jgi:CHAD domain-containing protein
VVRCYHRPTVIELSAGLLERTPEETCRYLCLGLLHEAEDAMGRMEPGTSEEALHDFRVALRRLRSAIGTYRPYLKGSVKRKLRNRLRDLAASTNTARDREVQVEWLSRARGGDDPQSERGARYLLERLTATADRLPPVEALRERFSVLRADLERSLSRLRLRLDEEGPSFLSATGELIGLKAGALEQQLRRIVSAEKGDELHRARIEAKRLRYLLEPLQAEVPGARTLVSEMKALQDLLGELQDSRVLAKTISDELERGAIEEARRLRDLAFEGGAIPDVQGKVHPDLLALLRSQRERRDRVFEQLSRDWIPPASAPFFQETARLARRLSSARAPRHHRRYQLSSVPDEARRRTPRFIRQSFLPGRRIREQVLSIRTGGRSKYVRTSSIEGRPRTEEPISRELYEALASAAPHRVERIHYEVRRDGSRWEIDEVPDRGLVLAEVASDGEVALPEWIAPLLVREVTGVRRFDWESLARTRVKTRARSAPERPDGPRGGSR